MYTKWEKPSYETVIESKVEGNTLAFTIINKEIVKEVDVLFNKRDILGKELSDAKLQIKDKKLIK